MTPRELFELQIRQLKRLLETKRISFRDSWCIIFSDYPSASELIDIVCSCSIKDTDLEIRFIKEAKKL